MNQIYRAIGMSKQNIHQRLRRNLSLLEEQGHLIQIIREVREDHPGMGGKALFEVIRPRTMGRDRFLSWYRENGLTIKPAKNWRRTTDSTGVIRFENLISEIKLTGVNQVWVSDITYYEMDKRFYYLTFVMDQYSRKIKGYHASQSMHTEQTTIPAVKMALEERRPGEVTIIHSDGGGQYYSKAFLDLTHKKLINSMGKSAYENPHAERLNRTIKNNYLQGYKPTNFKQLQRLLMKAVLKYNEEKPHDGLGGMTPNEFERTKSMFN